MHQTNLKNSEANPTKKRPPICNDLLVNTISAIADSGFEGISLRSIATASGCSTAVIFQYFGNKAGLIEASMQTALIKDQQFHQKFSKKIDGLTLHHKNFSELVASYIELRITSSTARFWTEILFKSRQQQNSSLWLNKWHTMRVTSWRQWLDQSSGSNTLAPILVPYCAMEEVYAVALKNHLEYRLLLRETILAITAKSFGTAQEGYSDDISQWLNNRSKDSFSTPNRSGMGKRLIDLAVEHIFAFGVGTLNQRSIAKQAKTSSSVIAYHFGNVNSFENEAIWNSLLLNLPHELKSEGAVGNQQHTISDWANSYIDFITPSNPDKQINGGFYVGVSRIAGQASLLANRRQELAPVINHLRCVEGTGTYLSSKAFWPPELAIDRAVATAFGVLIKGQAIISEALSKESEDNYKTLVDTASLIFPHSQ